MRFRVKPHTRILVVFLSKRGPSALRIGFLPPPPCSHFPRRRGQLTMLWGTPQRDQQLSQQRYDADFARAFVARVETSSTVNPLRR